MPLLPKPLRQDEVVVAREKAAPALEKTLSLLLRGGAVCYLEFERALLRAAETACSPVGHADAPDAGAARTQTYLRVNPEDVKSVLRSCGALLDTPDYCAVRHAYSDPVGLIAVDPFLSALCPLGQVPPGLARMLLSTLPAPPAGSVEPSALPDTPSDGVTRLPELTLGSVLAAVAEAFAGSDGDAASGDSGALTAASAMASMYEDALRVFTEELYADKRVPGVSFANFLAAEILLLYNSNASTVSDEVLSEVLVTLEGRLAQVAAAGLLEPAPPRPPATFGAKSASGTLRGSSTVVTATSSTPKGATLRNTNSTIADFAMTHTDVPRRSRKFEYYMALDDRRDEWLRGRDEKDARPMYLKHAVGYGGHLPEYQYHFGRTFHAIEEDLPRLTKPRRAAGEPLPADTFGPGVALKSNQMTEHHFSFA